jgi:hypothetical protein
LIPQTENIKAVSGTVSGSLPKANEGFIFAGWFLDADCTKPVDKSLVKADNRLVPVKENNVWKSATFYARFDALQTNLTISTTAVSSMDANQSFVFTIKGKTGTDTEKVNLTVSVIGNGSVTIRDLPVGDYDIISHSDWSWRFNSENKLSYHLGYNGGSNNLIYTMHRTNGKWLDGNHDNKNIF